MPDRCDDCGRRLDRPAHPCCTHKRKHPKPDLAQQIVEDIEADLSDRRGLRHELERCDDEIRDEIRDTWASIIRSHLS